MTIEMDELRKMHLEIKALQPRPGCEAYSLLCALGSCLGIWPRITKTKVEELRRRHKDLLGYEVKA